MEDHSCAVNAEPMACSEPPIGDREEAFKDLLLNVSQKMSKDNANQISFYAECNLPGTPSALEVLLELRRVGAFSPRSCAHLEILLRKINRCDLADIVVEHMGKYPDPLHGKRECTGGQLFYLSILISNNCRTCISAREK